MSVQAVGKALVFSMLCIYMISVLFVVWAPSSTSNATKKSIELNSNSTNASEFASVGTDPLIPVSDVIPHRIEAAIVTNSTIISLIALLGVARLFSSTGDYVANLLLELLKRNRHTEPSGTAMAGLTSRKLFQDATSVPLVANCGQVVSTGSSLKKRQDFSNL